MLLSIVIPVYNVEQYIEKCIVSCLNQDVASNQYEIILVDDGSPDNSIKICLKYEKEYPNIKVVSQANKGLSGARNTGLKHSLGDYVWFVDSDDWIQENCLNSIFRAIKSYNSDIYWLGHDVISGRKTINTFIPKKTEIPISGEDFFVNYLENKFYIWKFVYQRNFLINNKLEFYEGILYEDLEFTPRALLISKSCYTLPKVYYHYLMREGSIINNVKSKNIEDRFFICTRFLENINNSNVSNKYYKSGYKIIVNNIIGTIKMAIRSNIKLPVNAYQLINKIKIENFLSTKSKLNLRMMKLSTSLYYLFNKVGYNLYKKVLKR